jgi:membrane protease YdiL (CAAX protease family)
LIGEAAPVQDWLTLGACALGLLPLGWLLWRHASRRPVLRTRPLAFPPSALGLAFLVGALLLFSAYGGASAWIGGGRAMRAVAVAAPVLLAWAAALLLRRAFHPQGTPGARLRLGLLAVWAFLPPIYGLLYLLQSTGLEVEQTPVRVLRERGPGWEALALFAVVTAPVVEEVVFRGLLYGAARQAVGPRAAILATGIAFGLVHAPPWAVVPPLILLGVVLAAVGETTGSVLPCIAGHAAFNALTVAGLLLS